MDIGGPGTLGQFRAVLRRLGVELEREGATPLRSAGQAAAIPRMKRFTRPADRYVEITGDGNRVISCAESRALLAEMGIAGQIVPTPGHSADSVSLLLESGEAFSGDLPPEAACWDSPAAQASWQRPRQLGAKTVCPAWRCTRRCKHSMIPRRAAWRRPSASSPPACF